MIPIPKDIYDEHILKLSQIADSCQGDDDDQILTLSTDNAGGGNFLIMNTKRWAMDMDGIDAFIDLLKGIQKDWSTQHE